MGGGATPLLYRKPCALSSFTFLERFPEAGLLYIN